MPAFFSDSPEFEKLLAGEERPSLGRVALEIARDAYPDLDPDHYLVKIDRLAERVGTRCGPGAKPRKVLGQINWALFVEEKFEVVCQDY